MSAILFILAFLVGYPALFQYPVSTGRQTIDYWKGVICKVQHGERAWSYVDGDWEGTCNTLVN